MGSRSNTPSKSARVAIPYYGLLKRQGLGLERIFFFADVDLVTGTLTDLSLGIWNLHQAPDLACWLQANGVGNLLCSDSRSCFGPDFDKAGITVRWEQKGELVDLVNRWSREAVA